MATMIERVARAVCAAQTQDEKTWLAFLPEATAAIEAMREPTRVMRNRGSWHRHCERMTWQAMIDAALAEEV